MRPSSDAPAILRAAVCLPPTSMLNRSPRVGWRTSRSASICSHRLREEAVCACASAKVRRTACWSSMCAARSRRRRAISISSPAFCISRGSPEASALALANWLVGAPMSSSRRSERSPASPAAMKRALRSSSCHCVASTLPSVA